MSCVLGGHMAPPNCSHGRSPSTSPISIGAVTRSAGSATPPLSEIDPLTTMPDNRMFESGTHQRLLRLPEVIRRVGLKRTAIYQRMSEADFPNRDCLDQDVRFGSRRRLMI